MGHSEIGVTLNTYTHLGLEEAKDELKRMEELEGECQKGTRKEQRREACFTKNVPDNLKNGLYKAAHFLWVDI